MVTLNNIPQALGRYPNANAANGGFLKYQSYSGYASITDTTLSNSPNWTGAEVVIRKCPSVLDRCIVTAQSNGTINYSNTNSSVYPGNNNLGYFFQNDLRTLDQLGEWYLNKSSKYLQMYFGTATPTSYAVNVATVDTLLFINGQNYITVNNLVFNGSNNFGIYAVNSSYINITGCDLNNIGNIGINTATVSNLLIQNCNTNYTLNNAMYLNNATTNNTTVMKVL